MVEKVLVANRGEVAVRVMRALRELGVALGRGLLRARRRRAARRAWPTRPYPIGPGPAAESYLDARTLVERRPADGLRRRPSRLRVPLRERGLRRALRRRRAGVRRAAARRSIEAMGSKTRAREIVLAARHPGRPGQRRAGGLGPLRRRRGGADRLPGRREGVRRRGRHGLPRRRLARRARGGARGRARRGRRGSSATRPSTWSGTSTDPRHVEVQVLGDGDGAVDPPRRARLHRPAPPPEAGRGGPGADGRLAAARAHGRAGGEARARRSATRRPARSRGCWSATTSTSSR